MNSKKMILISNYLMRKGCDKFAKSNSLMLPSKQRLVNYQTLGFSMKLVLPMNCQEL